MNDSDLNLLTHTANQICTLTINRPIQKNSLTTALLERILVDLEAASQNKYISVLVLVGSGDVFSSGVDLKEFNNAGTQADELRCYRTELLFRVIEKIRQFPVPTVALINGHAVGAGAAMALSTDLALMSKEATIRFPEISLGIVPKLIPPILVDKVGARLAFELLLTGRKVPASEAKSIGLINKVCPSLTLRSDAQDLINHLSTLDRKIAVDTKLAIREAYSL